MTLSSAAWTYGLSPKSCEKRECAGGQTTANPTHEMQKLEKPRGQPKGSEDEETGEAKRTARKGSAPPLRGGAEETRTERESTKSNLHWVWYVVPKQRTLGKEDRNGTRWGTWRSRA